MLGFWENKGWINEIDPYGWFQLYFRYWLGRRSQDDERKINRWKRIISRFRGKLVSMIKDAGSQFDDYLISPKIRLLLLHWGFELTEKDFFINSTNQYIQMSYYDFNRKKVLKKQKKDILKRKLPSVIYKTKKQ